MRFSSTLVAFAAMLAFGLALPAQANAASNVTRATLSNGLQVVVVRDTLAPVVTTMLNYKIGSNDEPLDGLAHATEHMMFRGSKTISANQLTEIIGLTGGDFDADTQAEITQYFFTMPSQYLDVALRLEASRAQGLLMAQNQWNQERGAIEQEVTQDNSNAISRMIMKVQKTIYVGTPYGNNTLGTMNTFAKRINHKQLIDFYNTWYHPNNAIFVIVGNVNPQTTIARVKQLFGSIPAAKLPKRAKVAPLPLKPQVISEKSDQPYTLVFQAFRFPGYDSKEYAASVIATDVLNSQRGDLFGLTAAGKALFTGFQTDNHPLLSGSFLIAAVAPTVKPQKIAAEMKSVIEAYKKNGVPAALVRASIRREVAQASFKNNNISNLAFAWSNALAVQGLRSPDQMIAAYRRVTVADVNRVIRRYLLFKTSTLAYAVPNNSGKVSMGTGGHAKENNSIPPSKSEPLPTWATSILAHLKVPPQTLTPTSFTLSNGLRLIVQPTTISKTIVLRGAIDNMPALQEPKGQSGVGTVLASLMNYGSTTYDRLAYQAQLDKIAASVSVGTSFSLDVLASNAQRGMQLLADEELHPALPAPIFPVVRQQTLGAVLGAQSAPDTLAQRQLQKLLYPGGDPSLRHATPKSIQSLTLADLQAYYASAYRP
ncbi:MAG TPA: insulinase family protein, partial [Candidatus Dormibacteraeota bacterium]|nr:insulinase family protein [Candidatus Dormibacteraeota bacterium]